MYATADNVRASSLKTTVAKSVIYAKAMSTILAMEIFQARHDAVLATSKVLLDNSNQYILQLYLVTKLRKLPRAILKPSNKGSWQLPLLLLLCNNNKKCLILSDSSGLLETESADKIF